MTVTTNSETITTDVTNTDAEWLARAKEALWQYETKSDAVLQDISNCIGILENDHETLFNFQRMAGIAQQLKRYIEFMDFINEVLEDKVMDAEAVKGYKLLEEDRMLAQRTENALSIS